MGQRIRIAIAGAALVVVSFGVGAAVGSMGFFGLRAPAAIGSGYVGDQVVTLTSGDTSYGVRDSVAWRDASGSSHADGWPDCLPVGTNVAGIPFVGATIWHGDVGEATILWVDCSGRR